ncbi:fimbrial protein [Enterobacteriaceae bacterium RIT702]|nr:fimbrial protein [Enterobacteriaceae bacterium RIT702]
MDLLILWRNIVAILLSLISPLSLATDIHFSGALVAEPCVIEAGDDALELDFGNVIDRELYVNHRSQAMPFTLNLIGCSIDTAKTVAITFSGQESNELAGFLATQAGSKAAGIAVGMETLSGEAVLLNKVAPPVTLQTGRTLIVLRAYIQGEPNAIRERSISSGYFSAIATFSLNYQ